jgi:hypothetical protein
VVVTAGPSEDRALSATAPLVSGEAGALPTSVGRFVVLSPIGHGSMGVVVAAYDPVLDRRIALKVLRAGQATAGDARLIQEAQAMARLAHPNVVTVHEAGAADGHVYLAMEFVAGGTLRSWLAAAPRGWREIRDRFVEAGRGLAAAHDAGLVHRDFKPDNVLIGRDGHARVTDFGLVRSAPPGGDAASDTTSVAGTPRYMAPEQHLGQRADARADQFAFCVALYEALWQLDPFAAADPAARRARILAGEVAAPPPGRAPAQIAAAVLRGLAVDPERRYSSMRVLLDDLVRDPAIARRRRLRLVAVGLVGAALATAVNGAMTCGGDPVTGAGYAGQPDPRRFQLGIAVAWAAQWGGAVPEPMRDAFDTAALDQVARAGATSTNLWLDWSAIESAPGVRDWSYADHQVVEAEKRGLEPFAYTGSAPAWIGRDPSARCTEAFRNPPPSGTDAAGAAFREFFRALASRYCGRVKYYAFWNEPNGCSWMSCGCGDQTARQKTLYAHWLDDWYQAMREGCSHVVLAVGGLDCSWGRDPAHPSTACAGFIDELYANGAGDAFDAVAIHPGGHPDPAVALRERKALNWAAIAEVTGVLRRRGAADRMLWVNDWGFATTDDRLKAGLVDAALDGLRGLPNVFAAQYAAITDLPDAARTPRGLVSIVGAPAEAQLAPRAAWTAFRGHALGPNTAWHGPLNPGMEFQGQPPSTQFTSPIPFWGPIGAWQYHHLFPRDGNLVLGRKAGFYAAGDPSRLGQTLSDAFEPGRRYCFRSAAQGGRDNAGMLPYQIGYLDAGRFVALRTRLVAVDARWRETDGVCHDVAAAAPEVGRSIAIGFGSAGDGGASDIWVDNMQVTSIPVVR